MHQPVHRPGVESMGPRATFRIMPFVAMVPICTLVVLNREGPRH